MLLFVLFVLARVLVTALCYGLLFFVVCSCYLFLIFGIVIVICSLFFCYLFLFFVLCCCARTLFVFVVIARGFVL